MKQPTKPPVRPLTPADLNWIAEHRAGRARSAENAGELMERLRDEGER
jgi:hypothetical protein